LGAIPYGSGGLPAGRCTRAPRRGNGVRALAKSNNDALGRRGPASSRPAPRPVAITRSRRHRGSYLDANNIESRHESLAEHRSPARWVLQARHPPADLDRRYFADIYRQRYIASRLAIASTPRVRWFNAWSVGAPHSKADRYALGGISGIGCMATTLGYHQLARTPHASRSRDCNTGRGFLEEDHEVAAESGSSWPLHCA
jgi:hypothetical protein